MKSQATNRIEFVLSRAPERKSAGVKIDKVLIKQFACRIYGTIREQIIADRHSAENLLKAIFGGEWDGSNAIPAEHSR
jgi:hypothetical protein